MAGLHFQEYIEKGGIERMKKEHKFKNLKMIEKLIMDFEILFHLQEAIPDLIVKGGLAVPHHLDGGGPRRLSIDIDLLTGLSKKEVSSIMNRIIPKLREIGIEVSPHTPETASTRNLPLQTYFCRYRSKLTGYAKVKIDLFYGMDVRNIPSRRVGNTPVFGIPIDFEFYVCGREFLIGDKLTTLARHTIGIEEGRNRDIPKQVFDIGALLREAPLPLQVDDIRAGFASTVLEQNRYIGTTEYSPDEVWDDIMESLKGILPLKQRLDMEEGYGTHFDTFSGEYFGGVQYTTNSHMEDIMLIRAAVPLLRGGVPEAESRLNGMMAEMARMTGLGREDRKQETQDISNRIRRHRRLKGDFKTPTQAYLYEQIMGVEGPR